jgi:hypothetical protein
MRSVDCERKRQKCRENRARRGRLLEKRVTESRLIRVTVTSLRNHPLIRFHCSVDALGPAPASFPTNARSHLYSVYCLPLICATVHIRHRCVPPRQPQTFFRPPRSAGLSLRTAASFSLAHLCIRASRSAVPHWSLCAALYSTAAILVAPSLTRLHLYIPAL